MSDKQQRQQSLAEWINRATPFVCQNLRMVSGDASFRRYFRFSHENQSYIAVDAPPPHEDSSKFVDIAGAYLQHGVPVPKVYGHDALQGFYCLQDFGDNQFAARINIENMAKMYGQALDYLPKIQSCIAVEGQALPKFDAALLSSEKYLFTHWLLGEHLQLSLTTDQVKMIDRVYDRCCEVFAEQPQVGVHRDYHCRNLMITQDGTIGVIDFQDAVLGPLTYDIVSLLRDCYQNWQPADIEAVLRACHQRHYNHIPWSQFKVWFDWTGVQRHIKASGIFARLFHRDGKSGYLADIPHTLNYIVSVSRQYDELQDFGVWLEQIVIPAMQESLK